MEGSAARCIQGLSIAEHNYDHAVELLVECFGNPQSAHVDKLIKIPVASDKPSSLRFKVNAHIRGLKSLAVISDQYGSFLIEMIMSTLPDDIRLRVAQKNKRDVWKIKEILEVVKVEVKAREASEGVKVNP